MRFEESPHSRIITQIFTSEFLRLIFNWATAPRKVHSQLSNCLSSSVAESSPYLKSSTCVPRWEAPLENSRHKHLPLGSLWLAPSKSGNHLNEPVHLQSWGSLLHSEFVVCTFRDHHPETVTRHIASMPSESQVSEGVWLFHNLNKSNMTHSFLLRNTCHCISLHFIKFHYIITFDK